jgi:hypothetical protein
MLIEFAVAAARRQETRSPQRPGETWPFPTTRLRDAD